LLLPRDPDDSCRRLGEDVRRRSGADVAVIVNDSLGRAWRNGVCGMALGAWGLPALADLRGRVDLFGQPLAVTQVAVADELAAAASLLQGQADEGLPVVLVRGFAADGAAGGAGVLIRAKDEDLFR
jgi:coenzyme F420-0:L-glutamate ligase/coenzyme F420-1:gamma-L-glutamate ligase